MFLAKPEGAVTTEEKGSPEPKGETTTTQWLETVQSWQHSVFHAEKRAYTLSGRSPGLQLQTNPSDSLPPIQPSQSFRLSGFLDRLADYSGGTAPEFHRTSLLGPQWAPKRFPQDIQPARRSQGETK